MRPSRSLGVIVVIGVSAGGLLVGLAASQASTQTDWPGPLAVVREYPWLSLGVLAVLTTALTVLAMMQQTGVVKGTDVVRDSGSPPETRDILYRDTAEFVGRVAQIDRIVQAVDRAASTSSVIAVQAVNGMPGVGKTAFAVHVGHLLESRFPDRRLVVDMRAHTLGQSPAEPAEVLADLLIGEGIAPQHLPATLEGRAALWRSRMADKRVLLIIDNAGSTAQVLPLLPGSRRSLVIVTSRRRLGDLAGATHTLDVLSSHEAVQMFIRLAPASGADPDAVADLVRLYGNLPLAVFLLAGLLTKHPQWKVRDLVARAAGQPLSINAESRTLADALDLSYRHLSAEQQQFMRRLSLHPGIDFDAAAAAALAGLPESAAARMLETLNDEHLLEERTYGRYRLHDTVHEFLSVLAAADPASAQDEALAALLAFYQSTAFAADRYVTRHALATAGDAAPHITSRPVALTWLRAERHNLLACIAYCATHGDQERLVRLTAGVAGLIRWDGPWPTALDLCETAAAAAREIGDQPGLARALIDLGDMYRVAGQPQEAIATLREAQALCTELGDRSGLAYALTYLGQADRIIGDFTDGMRHFVQALDLLRGLGDRHGEANTLTYRGDSRHVSGDFPGAIEDLEEALSIFRSLGDNRGAAGAELYLGDTLQGKGDSAQAAHHLQHAYEQFRELGDALGQANALTCLAQARQSLGDDTGVKEAFDEALHIFQDRGDTLGEAFARTCLAELAQSTGDFAEAEQHLRRAQTICRDLGDRGGEAEVLNRFGQLKRAQGQPGQASAHHQEALALARQVHASWDEACALEGLGRCALDSDQSDTAIPYLRQALEIFERIGAAEAAALAADLSELTKPGGTPTA